MLTAGSRTAAPIRARGSDHNGATMVPMRLGACMSDEEKQAEPADASGETRSEWVRSVLERHEQPLLRYALRMTGDVESARDVVQETFLRLCSADRAKLDGHVAPWLFTVCRRRALDVQRKDSRMRTASDTELSAKPNGARDPAGASEQREGQHMAVAALGRLPGNQQEVIRLRFQGGLSYKQIAAVTELSVSHVGYLIHMGIKAIRERLGIDER